MYPLDITVIVSPRHRTHCIPLDIAVPLVAADTTDGATRDAIDGHEEREKDNVDNGEGPPVFPHALENARLARGARVAKLRWVIAP